MTEWEQAQQGYLYDANYDKDIIEARQKCADLCYEFNLCKPSDIAGHPIDVEQRNVGLEIALPITVGDNVWIGTNVSVLPGVTNGDY